MSTMTLTLPDDLSAQLEPYRNHLDDVLRVGLREIRMEHSLNLFKTGAVSLAKAARLANVSLREMTPYAVAQGVWARADDETLEEEAGR